MAIDRSVTPFRKIEADLIELRKQSGTRSPEAVINTAFPDAAPSGFVSTKSLLTALVRRYTNTLAAALAKGGESFEERYIAIVEALDSDYEIALEVFYDLGGDPALHEDTHPKLVSQTLRNAAQPLARVEERHEIVDDAEIVNVIRQKAFGALPSYSELDENPRLFESFVDLGIRPDEVSGLVRSGATEAQVTKNILDRFEIYDSASFASSERSPLYRHVAAALEGKNARQVERVIRSWRIPLAEDLAEFAMEFFAPEGE